MDISFFLLDIINNLTIADVIQVIIAIVLIWYSIETHQLKIEQRKALYLNLLNMEMKDKGGDYKSRVGYPLMVREIVEYGRFDAKKLYSSNFHQKIYRYRIVGKIIENIKAKLN